MIRSLKGPLKYASEDVQHLKNASKRGLQISADSERITKFDRRSQSLDRKIDDIGDSPEERQNRRQFLHLVSLSVCDTRTEKSF